MVRAACDIIGTFYPTLVYFLQLHAAIAHARFAHSHYWQQVDGHRPFCLF